MKRSLRSKQRLDLPLAATPRPGDEVTWYVDAQRASGSYVGHGVEAEPVVANSFGSNTRLASFDCLRLSSPGTRVGPNWQKLPEACLVAPRKEERDRFAELLNQRIPPGPTYLELIEEIWYRGYEVYVVGGTVRDVISGHKSNDVDIVTTMPVVKFELLLKSMFRRQVSLSAKNGFARLGGKGTNGDPFIDLKLFCHGGTGTADALFGSDFDLDLGLRDFACNAIYYDPINEVLVDPSQRGLQDAENRILALVCNFRARSPQALGQVAIRYFKFLMRGFSGDSASDKKLMQHFVPCISSLTVTDRIGYVKRQVLGKIPTDQHAAAIGQLELAMRSKNCSALWEQYFAPLFPQAVTPSGAENA
jgi:hypothetical protein